MELGPVTLLQEPTEQTAGSTPRKPRANTAVSRASAGGPDVGCARTLAPCIARPLAVFGQHCWLQGRGLPRGTQAGGVFLQGHLPQAAPARGMVTPAHVHRTS